MRHILICNWKDLRNPSAGGAEVIAFELARRLARDGHRVSFFTRSFPGSSPEETVDGVSVVRRGTALTVYVRAAQYYRSLAEKPDLVVDMVNTLPWFTPWYVPRGRRVLYVNQLAREVLLAHLPWPISRLAYAAERLLYRPYRDTLTVCYADSTRDDLRAIGLPRERIRVFPLGLDHARYQPGLAKCPTPLFAFVGRLVKMKRADLCIRALHVVVRNEPACRLIIVGRGPEEPRLRRLAQRLGLQEHVTFLHRSPRFLSAPEEQDQKVQAVQTAWALLLPSVKEGWGMVVTEAAACGTPAIVSNVTGLRDSVRNGETGLLLSANPTPEELASAMLLVSQDHELRNRLSLEARVWSLNFDWETSYRSFVAALDIAPARHLHIAAAPAAAENDR